MMNVVVEVRRPDKSTTTFSFQEGTYLVGREKGDIVMNDPQVSGRHGEIVVENGTVVYRDLGSTNGSFIEDGQRIDTTYSFPAGGTIRIGSHALVLITVESPEAFQKTMLAQPAMAQPVSTPAVPLAAPVVAPSAAPAQEPSSQNEGAEQKPVSIPAPSTASGEAPSGFKGYFNDMMNLFKYVLAMLKPRIVEVAFPIAVLTIPLPLVSIILLQTTLLIPALGVILALIITIVELIITIPVTLVMVLIVYPVIARYALALYLGEPVRMVDAWRQHKQKLVPNVINTFVTTLIGGLTLGLLGVYVFQIPYVEGKVNLEVNMRSWELLKGSWKRVVFVGIGSWVLFFIPTAIATTIITFIPFIGPILATVIWGLLPAIYVPTIFLLFSRIYFETRQALEGTDPRPAARIAINEN
ncbi:MAG: FHA domain-containing protein [Deltaproteobacteria bacterium]|nr:FHA domain-containing protein [Deltaproteobacteria bacterium]